MICRCVKVSSPENVKALEKYIFDTSRMDYFVKERLKVLVGRHTLQDTNYIWYLYENFLRLDEYFLSVAPNQRISTIKDIIRECLQVIREFHCRGFFHGGLTLSTVVITMGGQPKFAGFPGQMGSAISDLLALQGVLRIAIAPYYSQIDQMVTQFINFYMVNTRTMNSNHLDYIQHHPCFMGDDERIRFFVSLDKRIKERFPKPRSTPEEALLRGINGMIANSEPAYFGLPWTSRIPDKLKSVYYYNSYTKKSATGESELVARYDDSPLSFLHFCRNCAEHMLMLPGELLQLLEGIKPDHEALVVHGVLTYN